MRWKTTSNMAPEMPSRMLSAAPCELEEGELSPTVAADSAVAATAAIPAGETDASVYDFFDGVAAHQTEHFLKEQHSDGSVRSPFPVSSAPVPAVKAEFEGVQGALGSNQSPSPSSLALTELASPAGSSSLNWHCCKETADDAGAPLDPSVLLNEETPDGDCHIEETQEILGKRHNPSGAKCLLSPCGSLIGMLHQQPQQEERHHRQQETRSKGIIPLNLNRAHQQRMQTLDIQRGTDTLDDSLNIGPNDDLLQHVHRLSTKIRAQEDEKRLMAEESFQLEQILKRQYHADIREKTEQNNQLLRCNESLKQQVEKLSGECEGLRGALAVLDEVLEGFFDRQKRSARALQTVEDCMPAPNSDEALCANMKTLFAALNDALSAESATLDQETEKELQQRLEAASALCRAATAGAAAAASLSPTSWSGGSKRSPALAPAFSLPVRACASPAATPASVVAAETSAETAAQMAAVAAKTSAATAAQMAAVAAVETGDSAKQDDNEEQPLKALGTPPSSSEAQLETLKAQIERLRENLGAFTEGVLHAHKRHLRQYKPLGQPKAEGPPEKSRAPKALEKPLPEGLPGSVVAVHAQKTPLLEAPFCGAPTVAGHSAAEDKAHVVAAKQPFQPSAPWQLGGRCGPKEKARALWGNSALMGVPGGARDPHLQPLQQFLLGEPVRGALLLPADNRRNYQHQQPQQQQRLRCSPCSSGSPFDACCEAPPLEAPQGPSKPGIVLPPLRQRQRQGSKGPCARRRGPSGGSGSQKGAAGGGLTVSASAVSLLPALKPGAAAVASPASKGLVNSASAVDLSVVGRSLVAPFGPPKRSLPFYNGPSSGVYSHPPGGGPFAPSRHKQPALSPSGEDRGRLGATARSNSTSSSVRVFSRTRRSCSPVKERPPVGGFCLGGRTSSGRPGHSSYQHMTGLESKVMNTCGGETFSGTALDAKEEWKSTLRQRSVGRPERSTVNSSYLATTPPRELSPAAKPTVDRNFGIGGETFYDGGMWQDSNTRLVASAANRDAVAAAAAAAGLVSPPHQVYMHPYSQPPRARGPTATIVQLKHSLAQQQQERHRQPSPFGHSSASPAAATAVASCGGYFPSPVNACSPEQYSFVSPASGRASTLSTVAVSRGGLPRRPTPGGALGVHCGAFGLLSPMCYSNPPIKSPSSTHRSTSNIHTIQKQRHKDDDAGEWMHARP